MSFSWHLLTNSNITTLRLGRFALKVASSVDGCTLASLPPRDVFVLSVSGLPIRELDGAKRDLDGPSKL